MRFLKRLPLLLFSVLDKFLFLLLIVFVVFIYKVKITPPLVDSTITKADFKREKIAEDHYKIGNSWLKKNDFGIWEMYLEGSPYERGLKYGVLAKEIIESQEESFVNQLNEMIPSQFFQKFLTGFIGWMNRDMDEFIAKENLEEIYGISKSFSDKYDYVGPKFYRILYYHAAHDIGHALADLRIVGCTSFSVNNDYSSDGELLLGRNFDFYMGDDFAKDKLLLFVKPDKGYGFSTYSWAGFTGVVSGMNEMGLSITLNAAKSDIPTSAKDPISLLAREILQYAKNIDEAVAIAKARKTFVSESLMIGSAEDNRTVIIEKTPTKIDVYDNQKDLVVCSNHYQSDLFIEDKLNLENIEMTDSKFRYDRMLNLIESNKPLNHNSTATILRDRLGLGDKNIGLGNPKSINQLIAYHSVIFKPSSYQMWVSTYPYQMGEFLCYDLKSIFSNPNSLSNVDSLRVPKDNFIESEAFNNFSYYKQTKAELLKNIMFGKDLNLTDAELTKFIKSNSESYETYYNLGRYYEGKGEYCEALKMFETSLKKEVASKSERIAIQNMVSELTLKCNTK
jgi:isopenicillin-N N-acyltransferase-like protein